jgi:hypothetical protein
MASFMSVCGYFEIPSILSQRFFLLQNVEIYDNIVLLLSVFHTFPQEGNYKQTQGTQIFMGKHSWGKFLN